MRKYLIVLIALCSIFLLFNCSGGGSGDDDLPPYSDAPYSARVAAAITSQAIMDIAYDIEINGLDIPNVTAVSSGPDNVILTFSNAQRENVVFDYEQYTVSITGTLTVVDDNVTFNISVARCVSTLEVYYCTFEFVFKNNKAKKAILNGKEYDPSELN